MKQETGNGNEVALAVLRSRKETVGPETAPEPAKPAKDWSRHGLGYAATPSEKTAIRAEYAEKERELQERSDISHQGRKTLQAFLRMEQISAEARAEGSGLGNIKRRIDGKGVVIFTLDSGGTVRDAGKEVFFSAGDKATEAAALRYARAKWGKGILREGNRISRAAPEVAPEQRQSMER